MNLPVPTLQKKPSPRLVNFHIPFDLYMRLKRAAHKHRTTMTTLVVRALEDIL